MYNFTFNEKEKLIQDTSEDVYILRTDKQNYFSSLQRYISRRL